MTIEIQSLKKKFDTPNGEITAVDDIDLEIGESEFVSLVGPSGCGKTTTLRCVSGLETPTSGKIIIDGRDVTEVPANKRNLSMMFQNIALYPHMKIKDNISYPLKVRRVDESERYEQAKEAAEIMQIGEMLDKYPGELSGGQRQRAALARTIVQDPEAFLMDEPLSDLDAKLKVEVRKEVQRVHDRVSRPTLYVTHDQEEAMTMSDRIAVMNDGTIEQIGTPDELYSKPNNTFVATFIGNPSMNFFDGVLTNNPAGNTITIRIGDEEIEYSASEIDVGAQEEINVTLGVRPEELEFDETPGNLEAEISLIERIGDRMQVTLDYHDGERRGLVPADHTLAEGETVSISFKKEQIHVFDAESGEAIAHGSKNGKAVPHTKRGVA